jgi:hypothetical protein
VQPEAVIFSYYIGTKEVAALPASDILCVDLKNMGLQRAKG